MKLVKLLLFCRIICFFSNLSASYDPVLVVVIMVKNEEHVICETLQPFIDGNIDAFFVFDTGSTDNTIAVTQAFFEHNNIVHGCIEQEPFVDFEVSRNRALELAHQHFPHASFILMLDAEWYLNDAKALVEYCQKCIADGHTYSSYLIRILNKWCDFYTARLIRCNCNVQFKGAVHESIDEVSLVRVPDNIYFRWEPQEYGIEKTNARLLRDRDILFKEYNKNPSTRNLFYLARTCEDVGDLELAHFFYKKRIKQIGWDEEDFAACYRLAHTIEKLSYVNNKYTWNNALKYYLKAFEMRSHRAEPLICIAHHYILHNQVGLAFLYAHRAALLPYPTEDKLFIEKYAYTYYRYELLTRAAWYCNEFEIGEWAARKAVEACPEYEHAQNNLTCYVQRKIRA